MGDKGLEEDFFRALDILKIIPHSGAQWLWNAQGEEERC